MFDNRRGKAQNLNDMHVKLEAVMEIAPENLDVDLNVNLEDIEVTLYDVEVDVTMEAVHLTM